MEIDEAVKFLTEQRDKISYRLECSQRVPCRPFYDRMDEALTAVLLALSRIAEHDKSMEAMRALENELGCPIDVFWIVYRKLSGHGVADHNLYALSNGKIKKIKPETIMSGTYSNYPKDCSFTYSTWDSEAQLYCDTHSYYHFHDYGVDWFLTRQEAEAAVGGRED